MQIQIDNQMIDITDERAITLYRIAHFEENEGKLTILPLQTKSPLTVTILT